MLNIEKQIRKLYASSVLGNLSLTGAWVAILAARGYNLVDIGIAETLGSSGRRFRAEENAYRKQYHANDRQHNYDTFG